MQDFEMAKGQQFSLDQAGIAQKNTQANMQQQQGYTQDNMATEQANTQKNMQTAQNFDLQKMSTQQKYQLEQMAKSFGYDLSKMSKAQQYQLANMATSFGYDMSMQDDAQAYGEGMQDDAQSHDSSMQESGFQHDSSMQEDSQSFQQYQDEQVRTHQKNMFGMEQSAKLDEYDQALAREMASYDKNTPEGKLRIAQLESAQSSLLTETMTKTIGEVMGQSFIKQYGDGMTTEQMQKWLKDPTNLKNLEAKIKTSNLPPEKKSFLTNVKNVMMKTAPGKIYEAYSKAFREGLPKFTP
jgi:hypothetical protein